MTKAITRQDDQFPIPATQMQSMKAIVDGLNFVNFQMDLNIAVDEDTIIPIQAAVVTSDKGNLILTTREVAKQLAASGKGKMVFQSMSEEEKIAKIGE